MADTSLKPLDNRAFRDFIKSADSKMILKNKFNMSSDRYIIQCGHCFFYDLPEAKVPGVKPRYNCDMLHMPLQSWQRRTIMKKEEPVYFFES